MSEIKPFVLDARLAGLLFGAAFLVRLTLYLGTAIFGTDSAQFLLMADAMKDGRFDEALSYTYHPLYPLLAATAGVFLPSTEHAGFWVSMVLGAAAIVPLFFLVRAVFGRPAAFFTALIYAFQSHTVDLQADVMTEGAFCFFLYGSAWLCWRAMEDPRPERFVVAGGAAALAYLTRPEGILAVALVIGWPLLDLAVRRDRPWMRLAGAGACLATIVLLAFPFLVWVHSKMGRVAISAKFSVSQATKSVNPSTQGYTEEESPRYSKLVRAVGQVTGVLAPFAVLGLAGLRGHGLRGSLFFFSFPLGYFAGLAFSLRTHPWMSYRYVVPPMGMLLVLAALGMVLALRFLERRRPEPRWRAAAAGILFLLIVAPCVKSFRPNRHEEAGLRDAAAWLRARGATRVSSTVDKIGYLSGARVMGFDDDFEEFRRRSGADRPAYCVYLEEDLAKRQPSYLSRLGEIEWIAPAVALPEPPARGVQRVFIHPAR